MRALHSPKRDHVAATRVTNDVGAFLRNQANGRAQGTNEGSVSSTHCVSPLLLQLAGNTKLLPVVQLRSGVILLMGDPILPSLDVLFLRSTVHAPWIVPCLTCFRSADFDASFLHTASLGKYLFPEATLDRFICHR
jgi:hypothetical protein